MGVPRSALAPGAHYIAGGTAELLMGWVEHPKGVSAEQIAQLLRRHALAVTRSLKKP